MDHAAQDQQHSGPAAVRAALANELALARAREGRFRTFCLVDLGLDPAIVGPAIDLLKHCEPFMAYLGILTHADESEVSWRACVLYAASKLQQAGGPMDPSSTRGRRPFTLSQLLSTSRISIVDFFLEMRVFLVRAGHILPLHFGADAEARLQVKELQENFIHSTILFNHFKKVFLEYFDLPTPSGHPPPPCAGPNAIPLIASSPHFRAGWLLFLLTCARTLPPFPDLVSLGNVMVATLATLVLHVPHPMRKFAFTDTSKFTERGELGGARVVASLAAHYKASLFDVAAIHDRQVALLAGLAHLAPPPGVEEGSGAGVAAEQDPAGSSHSALQLLGVDTTAAGFHFFAGLLDGTSLEHTLRQLEAGYEEVLREQGEIDERVFLEADSTKRIGTPTALAVVPKPRAPPAGAMLSPGPSHKPGPASSVPQSPPRPHHHASAHSTPARPSPSSLFASPLRGSSTPTWFGTPNWASTPSQAAAGPGSRLRIAPMTPLTTARTTARWLSAAVTALPAEPSPELQVFFRSCDRDLTTEIQSRALRVIASIFPQTRRGGGEHGEVILDQLWAERRREESLKLYYHVLLSILTSEAARCHTTNFSNLLHRDVFHRALLACAAEVVCASHKAHQMAYPALLQCVGLTAFDLIKVIESFVRHEQLLTREIKRHLSGVEESALEQHAWERGSSLYVALATRAAARSGAEGRAGEEAGESREGGAGASDLDEIRRLGLLPEAALPPLGTGAATANASIDHPSTPPHHPTPTPASLPIARGGTAAGPSGSDAPHSVPTYPTSAFSPVRLGSTFSPMRSAGRPAVPPVLPPFASPQRRMPGTHGPGGQTCGEVSVNIFFQKVLKLILVRLKLLGERLHLPAALLEQVHRVVHHVLHHETSLFFCRHVDQLLLCSLYGVCKVTKVDVTFKQMIEVYNKMPQACREVIHGIPIRLPAAGSAEKPDMGDIIKLYNSVFVPRLKDVLLRIATPPANLTVPLDSHTVPAITSTSEGPAVPSSPERVGIVPPGAASPFNALPAVSPKRVAKGIYVSPLRHHKAEALLSPHSGSVFASVGESTHEFRSPSRCLADLNDRLHMPSGRQRGLGRLNFDDDDKRPKKKVDTGAAHSTQGASDGSDVAHHHSTAARSHRSPSPCGHEASWSASPTASPSTKRVRVKT